jgi:hypothetical protein
MPLIGENTRNHCDLIRRLVFPPKDEVVANEDVRSMSASEDNDALEDCKAQDGVVQDFRPEITQAHRPPEEANRCS